MWYLGFDCATKTFAWCLARIDLGGDDLRARAAALERALAAAERVAERPIPADVLARLGAAAAALDRETRELVEIADGETVDLVPGVPDDEVGTVARLSALVGYLRARVSAAVGGRAPREVCVAVEYQCGTRARDISAALVAHFAGAGHRVYIVAPGSKSQICIGNNPHTDFAARYAKSYDANKAHARACFAAAEALWPSGVKHSSAAMRGHVADSFLIALALAKMLATGDAAAIQARF